MNFLLVGRLPLLSLFQAKDVTRRNHPATAYRLISLLPIAGKVFEALISKTLVPFLESHQLLSDMQYGFRYSRSTGDLLSDVTDHISRMFDKQDETRSVALDIFKAFDKVWHQGLLTKLRSCGVT